MIFGVAALLVGFCLVCREFVLMHRCIMALLAASRYSARIQLDHANATADIQERVDKLERLVAH